MIIFSNFLTIFACIFLLFASILFLRAKDMFSMLQFAKIISFYGFPLIILAIFLPKFSIISFLKIAIILVLNLIIMIFLTQLILKEAVKNKTIIDAKTINLVKKKKIR